MGNLRIASCQLYVHYLERRGNFLRLLETLGSVESVHPLFLVLLAGVYPMGSPVLVHHRCGSDTSSLLAPAAIIDGC